MPPRIGEILAAITGAFFGWYLYTEGRLAGQSDKLAVALVEEPGPCEDCGDEPIGEGAETTTPDAPEPDLDLEDDPEEVAEPVAESSTES